MKAKEENYYLSVVPRRGPTQGDVKFALENEGTRNSVNYLNADGTLDFRSARKKYFRIHFALRDGAKFGLSFLPNVQEAIWITSNGICPTEKPIKQPDEFDDRKLCDNFMTLSVVNRNKTKRSYGYTLRFKVKDSDKPEEFDPVVISGGGGGENLFLGAPQALIIAGAAAGAALLIGLAKAVTKRNDRDRF